MKIAIKLCASLLCCGLALTTAAPAFALHVNPTHYAKSTASLFDLDLDGYERVEFVGWKFMSIQRFAVTQAGTYALSLTDMVFPRALRKLSAAVTTADDKLVDIFGSGSVLFDMQPGLYYLNIYARSFSPVQPGLFGLTLQLQQNQTTPVPVPAALWLFGSGLIGVAGLARRRRFM